MATEKESNDQPTKRASAADKTIQRISAYIADTHGGSVAGIDDARLHTYISDKDWIAVVTHERGDKEPLSDAEALAIRPKLFTHKHVSAE